AAVGGWAVSVNVFNRPAFLSIGDMRAFAPSDFLFFGALGVVFGVLSASYLRAIFAVSRRLSPLPALPLFTAAGAVCGLLWLLSPESVGGRELLRAAVENDISWTAALSIGAVKAAATILCLGAGFAGGIVSPTLVVGAMAGALFAAAATAAGIYDGPAVAPIVCGMMAFTAPAIGAPLAGILFVLELSGGNYPLTIAASLSVALSAAVAAKIGEGSYYEQQLRARRQNQN
ncbi:MAG: chloride channel protein, partial [Betaproteobacteria bacterium]|nr:chloride channel protein [Betaproteobacteria bacterium]